MDAIWERIERWLGANAPEVLASLNRPATARRLAAAERHLGVTFPDDVRASYLRHDGQRSDGPGWVDGWEWLSLTRMTDEWDVWKGQLDGGDFADSRSRTDGRVVKDWWHPKWIPLTYDGCGNHHCLDLNPGPKGVAGQVIEMWHDDAERPVESDSFRDWLSAFADELEADEYVLSEEHGGLIRKEDM